MRTYIFVIFIVACILVQGITSAPQNDQDPGKEMMDKIKEKAQEFMEHVQDFASKGLESAKAAVHDAMESAQQATHKDT